jgi:hypothetical protein
LRLATNPTVLKDAVVTMSDAWSCYDALLGDERVLFHAEPVGMEPNWRRHMRLRAYSHKVWGDAYLISFAEAAGMKTVSFDRRIRWQRRLAVGDRRYRTRVCKSPYRQRG